MPSDVATRNMDLAQTDSSADARSPADIQDVQDEAKAARFAAALGLSFKNPGLVRLALTHRSVLHVWAPPGTLPPAPLRTNERLEFLGDAVLGMVAAEFLYERYPEADEGTLTGRRVALVRAETLVRWAREIDLGAYLYLGTGERVTASARDRMLAGAFEALVGAIYLDRGQRAARRFLRPFLTRETKEGAAAVTANPKGRLQELLQERYRLAPTYSTLAAEGPAHARSFTVEVALGDRPLGVGQGVSKREAEQAAAAAALVVLAGDNDSVASDDAEVADIAPAADRTGPDVALPASDTPHPTTAGNDGTAAAAPAAITRRRDRSRPAPG